MAIRTKLIALAGSVAILSTTLAPAVAETPEVPGDSARVQTQCAHLGTENVLFASSNVDTDVAVMGVTWSNPDLVEDAVLSYRTLSGGSWSAWGQLDEIQEDAADAISDAVPGSEPVVLIDVAKVEVCLGLPAGVDLYQPVLSVIDGNEGEVQSEVGFVEAQPAAAPSATGPADDIEQTDEMSEPGAISDRAGEAGQPTEPSDRVDPAPETSQATDELNAQSRTRTSASTPVRINPRSAWGANESWMEWDLQIGSVRGAVIHHTAGTNQYTKAQVPGIINGIYYYHAITRGWGDIGYNVLVDKFGQAWQGRAGDLEDSVIGAHAYGANSQTFGISVLGSYDNFAPPAAAIETVSQVVAWKLDLAGVDPQGYLTIFSSEMMPGKESVRARTVDGHRAWNPTTCPGDAFYAQMANIRGRIAEIMSDGPNVIPPKPYTNFGERLSGKDRVRTAIDISRDQYPQGASVVYLARSDALVDALTAGVLTDGPILLTSGSKLSHEVKQEISRLKPDRVIAVGGRGVLPDSVLNAASAKTKARLGGKDRFETAAKVSAWQFPNGSKVAYLADGIGSDGKGSPDAVAGGVLKDGPILLAGKNGNLTDATRQELDRLKAGEIFELGRQGLGVSDQKIGGRDRAATSVAIAKRAFPQGADTVYLAQGNDFVDAVAGGAITEGPVVLVQKKKVGSVVCTYLRQTRPFRIVLLGGEGAVDTSVLKAAKNCK